LFLAFRARPAPRGRPVVSVGSACRGSSSPRPAHGTPCGGWFRPFRRAWRCRISACAYAVPRLVASPNGFWARRRRRCRWRVASSSGRDDSTTLARSRPLERWTDLTSRVSRLKRGGR